MPSHHQFLDPKAALPTAEGLRRWGLGPSAKPMLSFEDGELLCRETGVGLSCLTHQASDQTGKWQLFAWRRGGGEAGRRGCTCFFP